MKLTEALQLRQPLFEMSQFKDFKAIVKKESSEISFDLQNDLERIFLRMQNMLGDDSYEFGSPIVTNPNFYINLTKKVTQHELRSYDLTDIMKAPREHPDLDRIDAYTMKLMEAMRKIMQKADDPARKEPEYETIDSGSGYQVLKLYNYAAARMICNKYKLNHCIGSSNTSWFKAYGEDKGRDTYYIITDAGRAVAIHSGGNASYIITSHDNDSEIVGGTVTRGKNAKAEILMDINSSVPLDRVIDVLLKAFPSGDHQNVRETFENEIETVRSAKNKSLALLGNGASGYIHAIYEYDTPGLMLNILSMNEIRIFLMQVGNRPDTFHAYMQDNDTSGNTLGPRESADFIKSVAGLDGGEDFYDMATVAERRNLPDHQAILIQMAESL